MVEIPTDGGLRGFFVKLATLASFFPASLDSMTDSLKWIILHPRQQSSTSSRMKQGALLRQVGEKPEINGRKFYHI